MLPALLTVGARETNMRESGLTEIPATPGGPAGPRSPWKKCTIYNDIYKISTDEINAQVIIWIW